MKKVLFIRSPRYHEYYLPECMSFQIPLGMCSIASFLKKSVPQIQCEIIDCPAERIGWRTLEKIIRDKCPDVIAAGEPQAFFFHETLKVFTLAKKINPGIITIAGGTFFSSLPDYAFEASPSLDFIVKGEAEITFSELIKAFLEKKDPARIEGIVLRKKGKPFYTGQRPLLKNLDDLPMPDYSLLPLEKYSWYRHPYQTYFPLNMFFYEQEISPSVVMETSRGCPYTCDFCSLWFFWGEKNNGTTIPFFRKKSVQRTLREVDIAYEEYGRRFFFFTDPTFNLEAPWVNEFCDELLKKKYADLSWFAYLRPDFILRDEANGILEKMVAAGLRYAFIGAEKDPMNQLRYQGKSDVSFEALTLLKNKYPQVHTTVSFLLCLPEDSYDDIRKSIKYSVELNPSNILAGFFIFPGSTLFDDFRTRPGFKMNDYFPASYAPKFPYYAWAKKGTRTRKILLYVFVRINVILASVFLLFGNGKNRIFRWVSKQLQRLTYQNSVTFSLAAALFMCLLAPFLLYRRSASFKTCWIWKRPRWYND